MKKRLLLLVLVGHCILAQEPVHNMGNLKIHENGALGFHHDLLNNGSFDENSGLVGFYSPDGLFISGALRPIFNDMEVLVENELILDVGVGVRSHLNFIDGTLITPRTGSDTNIDFIGEAFYSGEDSNALIDGYAMMSDKEKFRFPIGELDMLRPLLFETDSTSTSAKSAYFFENPNSPSVFGQSFNTTSTAEGLTAISTEEFWHLEASVPGQVELIWTPQSNIVNLVEDVENLTIVGWHEGDGQWHDLGTGARKGNFDNGRIVSGFFDTTHYSIITFGGYHGETSTSLTNYLLSPNNDGINDYLVLQDIERSPNNVLKIFNRWGKAVYEKENYTNDFNGSSNTAVALGKNKILPVGVYFYVIELKDIDVVHQGYLYINE